MKTWPTIDQLLRTMTLTLLGASLMTNWALYKKSSIFESKWDEVMETARFNDLDGDGVSNVIIHYK